MKLFDSVQSPAGRIVHILAHELDLSFETTSLDFAKGEHKKPEFLAINPNGRVPVIQDGDFTLWESNAILTYLASKRPQFDLLPTDPKGRADVDRWLHWKSCHLHPAFMKVVYELYVKPKYKLGEPNLALVALGREEIEEFCGILDQHLAKNEFVANNKFSVVDLAMAHTLAIRAAFDLTLDKWKNISRWLAIIEARPSWIATIPKPY